MADSDVEIDYQVDERFDNSKGPKRGLKNLNKPLKVKGKVKKLSGAAFKGKKKKQSLLHGSKNS
jgi:hypothetical protein